MTVTSQVNDQRKFDAIRRSWKRRFKLRVKAIRESGNITRRDLDIIVKEL